MSAFSGVGGGVLLGDWRLAGVAVGGGGATETDCTGGLGEDVGERLQASGLQYARGTVGWSIGGGKGEKKVCFP